MFLEKIESKNAPKPVGAYSPAVKLGDFVYLSGQIGLDPQTNEMVEGIENQTKQVMENIKALLAERKLEMHHIVKTTILLANIDDFALVNEIYGSYFTGVYPARSAFEVARLPKDALVEIECFVIDTRAYEQAAHGGCGDNCGCGDNGCEEEDHSCGCGGCHE